MFDDSRQNCWHRLAVFLLPAIIVASPLIHAQLSTGFYLPQTLSTLSRIEELSNPLARLLFFVANPLFFVSPLLLYLLYRGFGHSLKERDLQTLLPALCTIGAFLFFALARGQIKGNWILPGFFEFVAVSVRFKYQTLAINRRRLFRYAAISRDWRRSEIPWSLWCIGCAYRFEQKLC